MFTFSTSTCPPPDKSNEINIQPLLDEIEKNIKKVADQQLERVVKHFNEHLQMLKDAILEEDDEFVESVEQSKDPHPWEEYLKARKKAIVWASNEMGHCDAQIAMEFSMDEEQVYLIRTYGGK